MSRRLLTLVSAACVFLLAVGPAPGADAAGKAHARAELEAASRAYSKALSAIQDAEARLATARVNAIEAGVELHDALAPLTPLGGAVAAQPADDGNDPQPPAQKQPDPQPKKDPEKKPKKAAEPAPEPAQKPAPEPPPQVKEEDRGPSFWEGWKRSVRLGFNASSGDSENTSGNIQFNTQRKSDAYLTRINTTYRYATRDGKETQNRLDIQGRHEWLAKNESKVGWWLTARAEFDEFRDWDTRLQAHGGISYQFIKNKTTNLKGRTGFGGSRTFGSSDDEFRPEALVTGIDLSHRFNETMNVTAQTEFFLEVNDETRRRFNNNVQWNILLDKESNMNLRLEVSHQFDSTPGGNREENNIYFDITLGWRF